MKPLTHAQQDRLVAEILACFAVTDMRPSPEQWFSSTVSRFDVGPTGEEGRRQLGRVRGCALGAPIFAAAITKRRRWSRIAFSDAAARNVLGVDTATVVGIRDGFDHLNAPTTRMAWPSEFSTSPNYHAGYEVGATVAAAMRRSRKG